MMRAMIVDDEILTAEHICRLLGNSGVEVMGYYSNPHEALEKVELLKPDVLFLDIEMPEMSGLELAENIQAQGYEGEIVFVTAYNQYAIEAFSVNALDYLLKPVMAKDILRSVERVNKRRTAGYAYKTKSNGNIISVSFFGKLSMYVGDDKEPIHWMTVKCAEILAFILLQREERVVSKWKLMEAMWPEKDKEKADINLRSTLSRLNKTLRENNSGISVLSTGNAYQLSRIEADVRVDAFELEKLALGSVTLGSENSDYYNSVISGYRGMLLEEFDSEWCYDLRGSYHRYFISAAKKLVKYYESVDTDPLKILKIIELLVKYEPYDEDVRAKALKLYYRLEGKRSAEKYYRQYRDLLGKELGIEPGQSIQKLYASLI